MIDAAISIAALMALLPFLAEAFFAGSLRRLAQKSPIAVRLLLPAVLSAPYALVGCEFRTFRWSWFALYALLPVVISALGFPSQADRSRSTR